MTTANVTPDTGNVKSAANSAEIHREAGRYTPRRLRRPEDIPDSEETDYDRAAIPDREDGTSPADRAQAAAERRTRPAPRSKPGEKIFGENHPLNIAAAEDYLRLEIAAAKVFRDGPLSLVFETYWEVFMFGLSIDTATKLFVKVAGADAPEGFEAEARYLLGEAADMYDTDRHGDRGKRVSDAVAEAWHQLHLARLGITVAPEAMSRFASLWPDEYEAKPELEFHDDDKTLPNFPGGAVGILYGQFGSHKTNVTLTKAMDAAEKGVRVLYAAGEGAYGVGKVRVPAHCQARGIATSSLRNRLGIASAVPLFGSVEQVQAFIARHDMTFDGQPPQIVVIDTLATALAGEDENTAQVASLLTDNGAAGMIKRAWGCTVLIIAHEGKIEGKGIRGSSGFGSNADFVLHVDADKDHQAIRLRIEKMRDGPDGREYDTFFTYEPTGVPVPVKISPSEYARLTAKAKVVEESAVKAMQVASYVKLHPCSRAKGLEHAGLADALTEQARGARPGEVGEDGVAEWDTEREKWRRYLGANCKRPWAKGLWSEKVQAGGKVLILKWHYEPAEGEEIEF